MRLFVALDINDEIRQRIARFLDGVRGFAPDSRWVQPESPHLTLKFIGEKPETELELIKETLRAVAAEAFQINIRGYGFFPNPQAPRVFWIGVEAEPKLTLLAANIDERMAALNIPKEEHAFNPHLTLARGGRSSASTRRKKGGGPIRDLRHMQHKLAALPSPEFGTMAAHEFFLYQSQPMRGGSRYTKLAAFPLRRAQTA